ncbi:SDR family oxidoreductase [Maribacter litopenaei]|uniref:SDR family oxidoreductase n=1 Tax=Maribacter litopenaei TaxID=2976127 RepID=A0ABY5YA96_9FLAO|nr:SDR family oxidoreductase [Maribacter litopenaei]UWX55962.1 SDR family oxidoreductase [Maribacter litopenaei]
MTDLFSLKNKVVALSGGTGTLGGSIAKYLIEQDAQVILLGRSTKKLRDKKNELDAISSGGTYTYEVDVLNEEALNEVREEIAQKFEKLDGLVNLAGGNIPGATLSANQSIYDIAISDTQKVLDINLFGTVIPTIVLSGLMARQGHGSIINISSMASKQAISRVLGYSMAKAGVDTFTQWMANEMASKFTDRIRVNAIAPGFFIGNQNRSLLTNEDGSYTERGNKIITNTPMARFGDASELNGMVHYLLSDASSFVTGVCYDVDGGFNSFSAYNGIFKEDI